MGFNNEGVDAMVNRLKRRKNFKIIIGGSIGKNKTTPNENAWADYEYCFEKLFEWVDYFVVNVSSPNTPQLRELHEKESLKKLLLRLKMLNAQKSNPKPILLKIAPDLTNEQLDDIIEVVLESKVDGVVATNTTISWENLKTPSAILKRIGNGGLSGKPLAKRSTEVIQYLHEKSKGSFPIIASGGIHSAQDAIEKLKAGACLVQLYTGFIYKGPGLVRSICKALIKDSILY
jgi:dihydroorotate dehydrogenase